MIIQIDSREKSKAIQNIIWEFDKQGIKYFISKCDVGDYVNSKNPTFAIDRKQNLNEVCNNVVQDHARFVRELERAKEHEVKLVFLIEHSRNIKCLEDVIHWYNPRLRVSPLAVTGQRLFKILYTIQKHYDTEFLFCSKDETGKRIIELLKEHENDGSI